MMAEFANGVTSDRGLRLKHEHERSGGHHGRGVVSHRPRALPAARHDTPQSMGMLFYDYGKMCHYFLLGSIMYLYPGSLY